MSEYMNSIMYNTHFNNYLSSKHTFNNAIQLRNKKFICNISVLLFSKRMDYVVIIFWIISVRVGKFFNIKFHKKKKNYHNPSSLVISSIYTKLNIKNLRFLDSFINIVPFERHRYIKEFLNKSGKSRYIHKYVKIRPHLWQNANGLFWAYTGIINEYNIIHVMRNLDFGEIPTVKVMITYDVKFESSPKKTSIRHLSLYENVKLSTVTMTI